MKELFIINDYDTERPMYHFLTNNASKCKELLEEVDYYEEKDDWLGLFEELCKKNNIMLEYFDNVYSYNYQEVEDEINI